MASVNMPLTYFLLYLCSLPVGRVLSFYHDLFKLTVGSCHFETWIDAVEGGLADWGRMAITTARGSGKRMRNG